MNLKCYDCGSKMEPQVLAQYPRNREKSGLVIFEDVPGVQCIKCGRRYLTDPVSAMMEDVLEGKVPPTGKTQASTFSLKGKAA